MKNKFFFLFGIFVFFSFLNSCSDEGLTENKSDLLDYSSITANIDEKVIECFNLTNEFRVGSEAYYWNEDNSTKTNLVGELSKLTLDPDLCRAAQVRALEIVKNFSHTRPNGSKCFTVLDDLSITYSYVGENIAGGTSTGRDTFNLLKEDNEDYNGQGHRRNMLNKNFTRIGIAYTYKEDAAYKYYWAMILAK